MSNEHVEVLREMRFDPDNEGIPEYAAALDAAIASLSATQPPAEAQPVDQTFAEWLATEMPAGTVIGDPAWWAGRIARQYAKRTSPPSAPVGVDDLSCCGGNDETPKSHCMDCSRYPGQLAQQPVACTHSWHDYGTVNRAWCSRCNAVAVIGHEERPYGVLSVTDDGEYRTDPIQQPAATLPDEDDGDLTVAYMAGRHDGRKEAQQPAAVDEAMVERIAALLHEEATDEPWAVAGVEHDGPDRDYYRTLARKVIVRAAQQPAAVDGVVTDEMVKRGVTAYQRTWDEHEARNDAKSLSFGTLVRAVLTAALAAQQGDEA